MFSRKQTPPQNSLRFCQHISELPAPDLFLSHDIDLTISKLCNWLPNLDENVSEAEAFGVVGLADDDDMPVLPVSLAFVSADPRPDGTIGFGEIAWVEKTAIPHYRADVRIHDADGAILRSLQASMEHAAISNIPSVRMILSTRPLRPIAEGITLQQQQAHERAKLKETMSLAENDISKIPTFDFTRVSIRDTLILSAPSWQHKWALGVTAGDDFEHEAMSEWRSQPWRPLG